MNFDYEALDRICAERMKQVPSVQEMAEQIESEKRKEQDEEIAKLKAKIAKRDLKRMNTTDEYVITRCVNGNKWDQSLLDKLINEHFIVGLHSLPGNPSIKVWAQREAKIRHDNTLTSIYRQVFDHTDRAWWKWGYMG